MSKSIFFPLIWRKGQLFFSSVGFTLIIWDKSAVKRLLFFPRLSVSLERNTTGAQSPPQTPGRVQGALQEYQPAETTMFVRVA